MMLYFLSAKLSNVTVIDMTGPEKRVLSGYHALGQTRGATDEILYEHRPSKKCDNFSLPELLHNLQLIVDMCEQDIIAIDKDQRRAIDEQQSLRHERAELQKIFDLEEAHMSTLEKALRLVDELVEPKLPLTLNEAEEIFLQLQQTYPAEYAEFGLADLAPGVLTPLLNDHLKSWRPLAEPTMHTELIKRWRYILDNTKQSTANHPSSAVNYFDPYSSLLLSSIVPLFRTAVEEWDPRNHQPMAALLDAWSKLLPVWTLDNILEQIVLPRIVRCVEAWDPMSDTVPVHIWILPWTGLLGDKMEVAVYRKIRTKLAVALVAWQPFDRSARGMIEPWLGVFPDSELQMFLAKHIVPKLQIVLGELVINPLQQNLGESDGLTTANTI